MTQREPKTKRPTAKSKSEKETVRQGEPCVVWWAVGPILFLFLGPGCLACYYIWPQHHKDKAFKMVLLNLKIYKILK